MRTNRALPVVVLLSILTLSAASASAQALLEPAQMSARTSFYLIWRGMPVNDAMKSNSLVGLWKDADFAPVRSAIFQSAVSGTEKDGSKAALTPEEREQYSTLLENAFVLGYLRQPESRRASAASKKPGDHPWNGLFFVYNRSGKEALLTKAVLRLRSQEKEMPKVSQISVGDVPALKVERSTGVTYWVEHGKYAASASELPVLEDVVARLEGKPSESGSLAQTAAYREAQASLGNGVLEFFLAVPNLKDVIPDSGPSGVKIGPALDALKFDAIHSVSMHISLEGAKTRLQGTLLGDAAAGTLFDLWTSGQQTPASIAFVPPDAVSYSESQFNLPAIYATLKRAIRASLPAAQQSSTDMMEGLAQVRLGMSIPDALDLVTGEFASIQTSPSMDPQKALYFLGLRKKPESLKLLRTIFGDQITSERNEGTTTFLKIALHSTQNGAGSAQWGAYHVAVTPDFALASGQLETLQQALARRSQTAGSSVNGIPQFQAARSQFPENLDGVSYFDFQKVDWQAVKDRWIADAKKNTKAATVAGSKTTAPASLDAPNWLTNVNPAVFSRHLHFASGASWKDAKGIHYDQWLE